MKKFIFLAVVLLVFTSSFSQQEDSLDNERLAKMINLSEVVIRSDLNIPNFIARVKNDTTFYKAFRSLHLVGFSAWNDIRINDKKGKQKASLQSKTRQKHTGKCRSMEVLDQTSSGDFFKEDGSYRYFTAGLYAGLFFTTDTICGENNIVRGIELDPRSQNGIEKSKQQLKMLFFNPGKKIPGIPFIGDRLDIFDAEHAPLYDFSIDQRDYDGQSCYLFSIKARNDLTGSEKNRIVIDSMITWFDAKTMEVLARNYDMSFDAGVYDFDVHMEVQLTRIGPYLVPKLLRYIGNWDVMFKKRERGLFTATLYDFKL